MWHVDLDRVVEAVRSDDWAGLVEAARDLAEHKDARGKDGKKTRKAIEYDEVKKRLPFWMPAGHFVPGHRHAPDQKQSPTSAHGKEFPECVAAEGRYPPTALSGLRFVEIDHLDDPDDLARQRARIQEHPSVVSCWVSPGGRGLHVTVLMDPAPANDAEAHAAFAAASQALELESTGDKFVKNLARVAFVSHDHQAYRNPVPLPLGWEMAESPARGATSAENSESETHGFSGKARRSRRTPANASERVCDNGVKLHGRFLGSEPKGSYGGRMSRKPYPSDLTDAQWEELGPLLPPDTRRGHPRTTDLREVVNGILYVLRGGIPWRLMPHDLPPWGTVWWYFRNWRDDGTWERVEEALRARVREAAGREATPSAAIIDSQSVKTTEKGGLGVTTLANG